MLFSYVNSDFSQGGKFESQNSKKLAGSPQGEGSIPVSISVELCLLQTRLGTKKLKSCYVMWKEFWFVVVAQTSWLCTGITKSQCRPLWCMFFTQWHPSQRLSVWLSFLELRRLPWRHCYKCETYISAALSGTRFVTLLLFFCVVVILQIILHQYYYNDNNDDNDNDNDYWKPF